MNIKQMNEELGRFLKEFMDAEGSSDIWSAEDGYEIYKENDDYSIEILHKINSLTDIPNYLSKQEFKNKRIQVRDYYTGYTIPKNKILKGLEW